MANSPKRIAVVDDEPNVLDGLRRCLARARPDWTFAFFDDPRAVLAACEEAPFDVVVSDMRMPDMSGLELADSLRDAYGTPCIILTGSPDLNSALYAINTADIFRYYTKPCAPAVLIEGIEAAMTQAAPAARGGEDNVEAAVESLSTQIGLAALNRLALNVIVVDISGRVVFTNQSACALLSQSDGLLLAQSDTCRASTPEETKLLLALIQEAASPLCDPESDTFAMAITRPSMKRPLSLFATPLIRDVGGDAASALVALFVSDPETHPVPSAEQIGRLYGLSRSEAAIAQALAQGLRVEEAATASGVTVSTARTYLKQIFSKTETSRQSELLKLVFASPAVLAA